MKIKPMQLPQRGCGVASSSNNSFSQMPLVPSHTGLLRARRSALYHIPPCTPNQLSRISISAFPQRQGQRRRSRQSSAADLSAEVVPEETMGDDGVHSNGIGMESTFRSLLTSPHDKEIFGLAIPALFRSVSPTHNLLAVCDLIHDAITGHGNTI